MQNKKHSDSMNPRSDAFYFITL